jgi:aminopeptidase N
MTIDGAWAGVSNGALVGTRRNADGTKTLHWSQREPNASYLTMVAAGEFTELRASWRGRPVLALVPAARAAQARRIFRDTPRMMEYFSRRIGVDYPWPKYAQVAVTHFMFGGMENTSATTLADTSLREARVGEESPESLVAHELAHQWWGDLVTCRDWSHAWLNEGFATYCALVWTEHAEGTAAFRAAVAKTADEFMASPAAFGRPLVHNVYRQPFDLFFDGVIYPKGALVLHMLRGILGDEVFWRGMRDYARQYAYESVTTADFQRAMETASGQDLEWFFDEWTRRPGYPKLEARWSWDAAGRSVTLRVQQLQVGESVPVYRMPVVVRVDGRDERVTIDARENVFTFPAAVRPASVAFDPDGWLLKRVDVVAEDREQAR